MMDSTFGVGSFVLAGLGVFALAVIVLVAFSVLGSNRDDKDDHK